MSGNECHHWCNVLYTMALITCFTKLQNKKTSSKVSVVWGYLSSLAFWTYALFVVVKSSFLHVFTKETEQV